jgi:hypothetical protein
MTELEKYNLLIAEKDKLVTRLEGVMDELRENAARAAQLRDLESHLVKEIQKYRSAIGELI